ncbi:hypothetical protein SporoP37_07780 [Sporosarcina sp. P37]|uniref:YkvI family membrane protein n=1 Tax=unclassified Sporosarcina TaxID=2647733 RepID=UPI000A17FAD5|nr:MULTISPECIES: hypothetical protein [unclassified Sporosarcina]ARK24570.1 hypothetical protein SporoP37_07780 [Sporosarcina sp. P37]PID19727.1 hypothetical protein CSV62_00320 [Sporosarcina sp. P35]
MKEILKMSSAFIGIVVGAGFASGNEIMTYFTSFGYAGMMGAVICTALFAYLGMTLTRLGSRMQTISHKDVIYKISGRYAGVVVDGIIIFTLFGVGVVMLAGAGANLHQQFGLPSYIGSLLMIVLVFMTVLMNVDKVVAIIGSVTPFLILTVIIVSAYSIATMDTTFAVLNPVANALPTTLPNWLISAVNYVSFNIALGASMSIVMGGAEKNEKIAAWGGFIGGLGLGILILLSHLAIFSQVEYVSESELPMLAVMNNISPIFAVFMAVILYGMIFNTAVSMFYAFGARFIQSGTMKFKLFVAFSLLIGYVLSFFGFTNLVRTFYPIVGYLGLFLVAALILASFRMPKKV